MKKIQLGLIFVLLLMLFTPKNVVKAETIPTISIVGVTEDAKVTIQTHNYPANIEFDVRMGRIGTQAIGGVLVGTFNSGAGGSQKFTFDIPAALHQDHQIAIRTDAKTGGFYSFNWFFNTNAGSHTGGTAIEGGAVTPVFMVVSVKKDTHVTIDGSSFPTGEDFNVLMGKFGTQGVGGTKVGSFTPKSDGTVHESFDIPSSLKSENKIAIRVESTSTSKFAHTWFLNDSGDSGGAGTPTPPTGNIPTISILSVVEDASVTLQTHNFPANRDFKVLMGKMWTKGINGIEVTTISSGSGGSFTLTFDIPAVLKGDRQIAIRLQNADGGFYAYNWFYNNTASVSTPPSSPSPAPGYTGIPTFSITSVIKDSTVTIKTNNFPADYEFKVLMGEMGTKGINGVHVTTINSGAGGSFTETFDVPSALAGHTKIAIRLESTKGGFFAYNWFFNNTYP